MVGFLPWWRILHLHEVSIRFCPQHILKPIYSEQKPLRDFSKGLLPVFNLQDHLSVKFDICRYLEHLFFQEHRTTPTMPC